MTTKNDLAEAAAQALEALEEIREFERMSAEDQETITRAKDLLKDATEQ